MYSTQGEMLGDAEREVVEEVVNGRIPVRKIAIPTEAPEQTDGAEQLGVGRWPVKYCPLITGRTAVSYSQ